MEIPKFKNKGEHISFLVENKDVLIAQKKAELKRADGVVCDGEPFTAVVKSGADDDTLTVKAAINTTNVLDSHDDVHINGLWSKSLKENKMIMHIQEHEMKFSKIISDGKDLKAKAVMMPFKDLGVKYDGETQVLLFESKVKKERNAYMYNQYKAGNVKNHSVGMRYVKLFLAVNDDDYKAEKDIWDKYYPVIANKELADSKGYFWAVTEAKVIEGSAVPIGSNQVTPTMEITEPEKSTRKEPSKDTQKNLMLNYII